MLKTINTIRRHYDSQSVYHTYALSCGHIRKVRGPPQMGAQLECNACAILEAMKKGHGHGKA